MYIQHLSRKILKKISTSFKSVNYTQRPFLVLSDKSGTPYIFTSVRLTRRRLKLRQISKFLVTLLGNEDCDYVDATHPLTSFEKEKP